MKKKTIEMVMQYIESSARKAAIGPKTTWGTKQLPDALKEKKSHE